MTQTGPTSEPGTQITAGLFKLALVLRHQAWQASGQRGLTPTQSQILALVGSLGQGAAVTSVAQHLSITKGTASEAVSALERKGLVRKRADPADGRAVILELTQSGRREARHSAQWPEVMVQAVAALRPADQSALLRGLIALVAGLQERGAIPTSRMCTECRFFWPNRYPGEAKAHYCGYLDAAIAEVELRIDCAEMEPVDQALEPGLLEALLSGAPIETPSPNNEDGPE